MTFRKGIQFLLLILPVICKKFKNVEFLICGGGKKKNLIEAIVKEYNLER